MTIDVARLVGAITREISTRDIDGQLARVVSASRAYDTSAQDLWDALSNPERVRRWMGPITGDFRLGGRFAIEGNASGDITTCDAPKRLEVTWEYEGNTSWVRVVLEERAPEVTELLLEHAAHVPEAFWDEYGPGATGVGWELSLAALETVVAPVDGSVPLGDEEAFFGSEAGKQFVRGSSQAWGQVAGAAGTDTEAARAAAERTTAFYGG